jgi:hypothetical protein
MRFLDSRIVGTIHGAERSVAGNAALELFLGFLDHRLFERISAPGDENRSRNAESNREGLQARRILKEVISDK